MLKQNKSSSLDSSSISNHFFSNSYSYIKLQKLKSKPYRFFYFSFLSKEKRENLRVNTDKQQQLKVEYCWKEFIKMYFNDELIKYSLIPKKKLENRKIIWQYWAQGIESSNLPETVKLCFKSVDNNSGDYTVIRLDEHNIHDYLDLPDFVWDKKKNPEFKQAFFADLIRLALLDNYGGIWLDATVYLTSKISVKEGNCGFFMYQRDYMQKNRKEWNDFNKDYFSWDANHKINTLNSVIFSNKNDKVIHICLDILLNFWRTQDHIPHYFFFQIMFNYLINNQLSDYQCTIIDDTKPHLLAKHLDQPFNKDSYEEITAQINIHKISYVNHITEDSYYQYLLNNT